MFAVFNSEECVKIIRNLNILTTVGKVNNISFCAELRKYF